MAGPEDAIQTAISSSRPGADFLQNATAALVPVAEELDVVHDHVRAGALKLDEGAAHRLLATLSALQSRVHMLITEGNTGIGQPLQLGHNFVGQVMGQRLRSAAFGAGDAAIPVLKEFALQLERLEDIVRRAAGLLSEVEEQARDRLGKLGEVD